MMPSPFPAGLLVTYTLLVAVLVTTMTTPSAALRLTEVLYVTGCRDSKPRRTTTACFAGVADLDAVIELSLRGLNFPQVLPGKLRVELVESVPLLEMENNDAQAREVPRIHLTCESALPSESFPTQLLRCSLANPVVPTTTTTAATNGLSAGDRAELLEAFRASGGTMWFDVVLQARAETDAEERDSFDDVAVLRHAVELDVRAALRRAGLRPERRSGDSKDGSGSRGGNLSTHPLERLYAHRPLAAKAKKDCGAGSGGNAAADNDNDAEEEEEDRLWIELGIGGLKKELRALFRRVFLSRLPSLAGLTESLDIQHVRGVILYGPPGNGKTLIARSLFKLLGPDTRLTVVSAADILSKFVGESEKNLRDAFGGYPIGASSQAETDRKDGKEPSLFDDDDDDESLGDDSIHGAYDGADAEGSGGKPRLRRPKQLHVLVIDEFESLFRRRGHSEDESSAKAVYDGVTNTLLSLMDGIENRNDLLVVGLTNRLQSVDSAMLRPGRFEVLIEVPAPDVSAREEIFFIHTAKLREAGYLASNVSLHDLAVRSGGFSGSDIAGAVRSATSYALLRYRQRQADAAAAAASTFSWSPRGAAAAAVTDEVDGLDSCGSSSMAEPAAFVVTTTDLTRAMQDIRDAKDEASSLSYLSESTDVGGSAVDYDNALATGARHVKSLVQRVAKSRRVRSAVVSVAGAAGTGKSFTARRLTEVHPFATVRFLSCRRLADLRDRGEQLEQVRDALSDASRAASGLVVLDDFELLLDSISGHAEWEGALRNMLYEFRHRPRGVSRSLRGVRDSAGDAMRAGDSGLIVSAGSALHDEHNYRVLIVTATRRDALVEVEPDVRLRVRPIHRSSVPAVLAHYNVSDPALAVQVAQQLPAAYPPTVSFRNFLRITDMALLQMTLQPANGPNTSGGGGGAPAAGRKLPRWLARGDDISAGKGVDAGAADGCLIASQEDVTAFAHAVEKVVIAMGLSDSFTGWYSKLPRDDLFVYEKHSANPPVETPAGPVTDGAAELATEEGIEVVW